MNLRDGLLQEIEALVDRAREAARGREPTHGNHHSRLHARRAGAADDVRALPARASRRRWARQTERLQEVYGARQPKSAGRRGARHVELSARPRAPRRAAGVRRARRKRVRREPSRAGRQRARSRERARDRRRADRTVRAGHPRAVRGARAMVHARRRRAHRREQHHAAEAQSRGARAVARAGEHHAGRHADRIP